MDILKIGVLGIVGVLLAIPLKVQKAEYSLFVSMAVCICIFVYIISKIEILCQYAKSLEAMLPGGWDIPRADLKDGGDRLCVGILRSPV